MISPDFEISIFDNEFYIGNNLEEVEVVPCAINMAYSVDFDDDNFRIVDNDILHTELTDDTTNDINNGLAQENRIFENDISGINE